MRDYALESSEFPLDELARASRRGDLASFERLVRILSRTLIARAYRYTRDWDAAEDICQETWLAVHTRIQRYDPARSFKNWLLTIHRRRCLDHLRKASTRRERPGGPGLGSIRLGVLAADDPAKIAAEREFMARLGRILPELGERQRRVFILVDIEQMGQEEAAEILGMEFGTLRSTLHFARRRLADLLGEAES